MDAGWCNVARDANGLLVPLSYIFPNGMRSYVQRMHALGAKVGLYIDCTSTVGDPNGRGQAGTPLDYAERDAALLASWNIDKVKVDGGNLTGDYVRQWYQLFCSKLDEVAMTNNRSDLIIVEGALCSVPGTCDNYPLAEWMPRTINHMRLCGDGLWGGPGHAAAWEGLLSTAIQNPWLSGPGHFVYQNSLVGVGFMHDRSKWGIDDSKAFFGISAMMGMPMYSSSPPTLVDPSELTLLFANAEFLEIVRDSACIQGWPVTTTGYGHTWVRPLANGDRAVGLWNQSTANSLTMTFPFTSLLGLTADVLNVRDVFNRTTSRATNSITAEVGVTSSGPPKGLRG